MFASFPALPEYPNAAPRCRRMWGNSLSGTLPPELAELTQHLQVLCALSPRTAPDRTAQASAVVRCAAGCQQFGQGWAMRSFRRMHP